jgi:hypothetical protein
VISAKNIQIGLVAGAVVLAGLLLVSGASPSLGSLLLIGVVLLCPLMMLGMHGGGHEHSGDAAQPTQPKGQDSQATRPHLH